MSSFQKELWAKAADILKESRLAIAMTGAGISVPSGIPDFRSPGGLWSKFDPQQVCSDWALINNPHGVWEFLLEAVKMFAAARPNPGHLTLARMEQTGIINSIITQNIDNLHQLAGSANVIEFHGGCGSFYCNQCRKDFDPALALNLNEKDIPWLCNDCQGIIRPSVVFFGEQIPAQAMLQSQDLAERADVVLIVGTSGEVAPANVFPQWIKRRGGKIIEINLGSTAYDGLSDLKLDMPAEIALPGIMDMLDRQ
ncbi:NAD-dependent deacylase [Desulfonatronovibrio hydrogenovorans]|uniref:NAD-dependent deacylase n=1 Tax=Desulfonatronovibrio hydrogenovorans TaxID=53245 RepID=UPI00048E1337|nr:NAD-dependent deacylase [Desulfonatronovibrio hydrogenovorans]